MSNSILYIVCAALGAIGAFSIYRCGSHLGLVDQPNSRSSHSIPVPKGGGAGILAAFILTSLVYKINMSFWVPAVVISFISFFGDKYDIPPKLRLVFQFAASLVFIWPLCVSYAACASCFFIPVVLGVVLCVFITGTANFYNFMDGINGIAGVTGIVGFSLLAVYAYQFNNDPLFCSVCICVTLACAGFLPFNMPKAKVFMGDVGSILLGFVFACIVIMMSKNVYDFICLSSFLFMFYADELTTMAIRIYDRERLTKAHRRHLYQHLANELGFPHWKVSVGFGLVQLIVGISILATRGYSDVGMILLLVFYSICFTAISYAVRKNLEKGVSSANNANIR